MFDTYIDTFIRVNYKYRSPGTFALFVLDSQWFGNNYLNHSVRTSVLGHFDEGNHRTQIVPEFESQPLHP